MWINVINKQHFSKCTDYHVYVSMVCALQYEHKYDERLKLNSIRKWKY